MIEDRRRLVHAGTAQPESNWNRPMFAMGYSRRKKLVLLP